MTTEIRAALDAFAPELEARFARFAKRQIERLVERFGPQLRGIANSDLYRAYAAIAPYYDRSTGEVNEARIEEGAREYARATAEAWADKIEGKLGELDEAEVKAMGGCAFRIAGMKGGRRVLIEQDMIVNVSPKGTLFNQFPARIYVDGKFTPAAKYAAL